MRYKTLITQSFISSFIHRYWRGKIGIRYGRRYSWLGTRPVKFRFGRRWRQVRYYRGKLRIRFRNRFRPFKVIGGNLRILYKKMWSRPRTRRSINRRRRRRTRRMLRRRKRRRRRRLRRRRRRGRRTSRRRVMRVSGLGPNKYIVKRGSHLSYYYRGRWRSIR